MKLENNRNCPGAQTGSRPYDLIAIDLDGTLIDADNQFFPGGEEAVNAAGACGIQIVPVTGRSPQGVLPLLARLLLNGPFITSGGAQILDSATGCVIDRRPMPLRYLPLLVRLGRDHDLAVYLEYPDRILGEPQGQAQEQETRKFGYTITWVKDLTKEARSAPNKLTMVGEAHQVSAIKESLTSQDLPINITQTGPKYLDFCGKGVHKGSALQRLAKYLRIPLKRVAAVGDYENDVEMFRVAGLAIAMGNAPAKVLQAAHLVAPASDQGGAAWAIHQVITGVRVAAASG